MKPHAAKNPTFSVPPADPRVHILNRAAGDCVNDHNRLQQGNNCCRRHPLGGCGRGRGYKTRSARSCAGSLSRLAPLPQIDAKRAFEYTREVTAFGPRYMGSENHKKLERYILDHLRDDHLKGDEVEDDAFTADTVEGKFPVRNIIAKFPGKKDGIIAILGHYDTNYPLRNTGYVGANDGGSSTAILLEFANQLPRQRPATVTASGWSGPTAKKPSSRWSDTDSLYGTRHLAEKWEKDGTLKKIKALMVMDMIATPTSTFSAIPTPRPGCST